MARNPLSPIQRRVIIAEAEGLAQRATEMMINWALDQLYDALELRNHKAPFSQPMKKAVEATARKVLHRRFKTETRGRKQKYPLGFFNEQLLLTRGAELAHEGVGASKAAKIIYAQLKAQYDAVSAIMERRGIKMERGKLPTVSAIKGRLERSSR
jgi:hypothetical protein